VAARVTVPAPPLPPPGSPTTDPVRHFAESSMHLIIGLARVINGLDAADDRPRAAHAPTHRAMAGASEGAADLVEGMRLVWAGRPRSAAAVLERAVANLRRSDRAGFLPVALGQVAYVRALLGDAGGAAAAADDASHAHHTASRLHAFVCGQGEAWAAAAAGELSAARQRMATTAAVCRDLEQPVLAAQAWYDVARLGDAAAAARPLRRLALRSPEDSLPRLLAAHVDALAAGDAAGVADAAREARRWGHRLHAAEAAAQAAALYARRSGAEAEHWRVTAHDLVAACEGARTPALMRLHDLDLTSREREIVGLVARGMSNREVADRLHLSVRTVGNHLQAAYAKLGVHKREELAGLLPFG
jgi:DNA-binding CsgD family transcriptional regulator